MTLIPESVAYSNVENVRAKGAPSTGAQGFFEALHSARSTIGIDFRTEIMMTLRVKGAAYRSWECKRVTVKAEPLEVRSAMVLEVFLPLVSCFFRAGGAAVDRGGPGRRGRY